MIKKVVSAKEGEKRLSVEYNPITKKWKVSKRSGRLLCVVPSHKSLIKVEEKKGREELRAYVKERFPESRYDIKLLEDRAYIALCKGCFECEDIELEPFALARLFGMYGKDGFVIDFGKNKTVFVEVEGGLLKSFRVLMRGGDYLTQRIVEKRGLSFEKAEELKKSEGLNLKEVREGFFELLELSGYTFKEKSLLLTGGGSRLRGIGEVFTKSLNFGLCDPEYAVCLGACLREVLKNPYPDFTKKELSQQDIKRLVYTGSSVGLLFFLSFFAMDRLYSVEKLKDLQASEFKRLFPKEPVVSLYDQVRAKVYAGEEYKLTKALLRVQDNLRPGMKIYTFDYAEGRLIIKGEADRNLLEGIKPYAIKDTAAGRVEFEIRWP
ncbi:MAG: cell division FtsA domain-containing protein [Aquificaceae bacterium]